MLTAVRYFLWDTLDAIVNFVDLSFVIHGELDMRLRLSSPPYVGVSALVQVSRVC